MREEKSTQELILSLKACINDLENERITTDQQLVSYVFRYLFSNNYEVQKNMKLPRVVEQTDGSLSKELTSGIVVRVGDEFVPIEVKMNGTINDYKRYITKIQIYVQRYEDVQCSLAMFLSRKEEEKVYNLDWKRYNENSKYRYILARYATYRADNKVFVRKNPSTAMVSSLWNH